MNSPRLLYELVCIDMARWPCYNHVFRHLPRLVNNDLMKYRREVEKILIIQVEEEEKEKALNKYQFNSEIVRFSLERTIFEHKELEWVRKEIEDYRVHGMEVDYEIKVLHIDGWVMPNRLGDDWDRWERHRILSYRLDQILFDPEAYIEVALRVPW